MAYATTDQLKRELGIDTADTSEDAYLTDLLSGVTAWIDTYTGRTFASGAVTVTDEVHDYTESNKVWLDNMDIQSVTAVKVGDVAPYTTLDPTAYKWNNRGRLTIFTYPDLMPDWSRTADRDYYTDYIRVTYTYGGGGVPADITRAAIDLAAQLYRDSPVKRESLGDYEVMYQDLRQLSGKDSLGVLDAYKLRRL